MKHYINKSALVAEIERLAEVKPIDEFQSQVQNKIDWLSGKLFAINSLRVFLDTLDVKEVDLEKEFDNYAKDILACDVQFEPFTHLYKCAKYFFELGLKAQSNGMIEALRTEYEKGRADAIAEMQKEWSEEDEVKINRIVACLENLNVADNDILLKDVDWLKSLKERYAWKPSDEQIRALEYIINNAHNTSYSCKIAKELLEQLKKLKGE